MPSRLSPWTGLLWFGRITVLAVTGIATALAGDNARDNAWDNAADNAANNGCPDRPSPSITSAMLPADVCIPDGFKDVPVDYFDDFAWRGFLALVWPVSPGHRGLANKAETVGAAGPRMFETLKSMWEVFHEDGSAPLSNFQAYDGAASNACNITAKFGDLILASFSGIDDIGQAGAGELAGPLVAQNGRYVRYQTLYNQTAFDFLVRNRYYLRGNFPKVPSPRPTTPVMEFPDGSIVLKAAWLDMAGFAPEQVKRYYTRTAMVRDPNSSACSRVTVGLVGLHIVQKTPSRPQWIWSSFEQIDSVPPSRFGDPVKFTFHDGTKSAMPAENPLSLVPLAKQPAVPFNVERPFFAKIHPKTELTNYRYQELLQGTVWQYYGIVVTQWPRMEGNQALPVPATLNGDITNTFPGAGAFSAFANVTMETFDQGRPQLGCMSCHNQARMAADFMWSVLDHAYPAKYLPGPAVSNKPPQ
jgi:hypothetical protein